MDEPTSEELKESLKELESYRDRLKRAVSSASKKLRMQEEKINNSLENNEELKKLEIIIKKLESDLNKKEQL